MRNIRVILWLAAFLPILFSYSQDARPLPTGREASGRIEQNQHVLRPGDVLDVQVFGEEELRVKGQVEANGNINLNLLGKVRVEGLTAEDAAKHIRELYMVDYLVDPIISVTVTEFAKFRFTMLGQIKSPGVYSYNASEKLNILQAIAKAGGYTRIGEPSRIIVKRVVNGKETIIPVNAKAMAKEAGAQLFEIRADDTITVGETTF
ncbi:MAG: polysaccharide biosynthesis/export family protein [Verrucomicrobiales bacterium]